MSFSFKMNQRFVFDKNIHTHVVGEKPLLNKCRKLDRWILTTYNDILYVFRTEKEAFDEYLQNKSKYISRPFFIGRDDLKRWQRLVNFYEGWNDIHFGLNSKHFVIYTDASVCKISSGEFKATCCGVILSKKDKDQLTVRRLIKRRYNFDTKDTTRAEYMSVKIMLDTYNNIDVTIVTDNNKVLTLIKSHLYNDTETVNRLLSAYGLEDIGRLNISKRIVRAFDSPAHVGVLGNIMADKLTKSSNLKNTIFFASR